jgi:hypothetical protein
MPRGGARANSGPKSNWKYGKTTTIRVPIALSAQLLEMARQLDQGNAYELVSSSKEGEVVVPKKIAKTYADDIAVRLPLKDRKAILKLLLKLINKIYNPPQPAGDSSQATVE